MGSAHDLHANKHILLHFTQFQLRRQKVHQPYGPWEHFPSSIWRNEEAPPLELDSDDTYLCQFVHTRRLQSATNAICFCAINAWLITRVTCQMISRNHIVLFLKFRH